MCLKKFYIIKLHNRKFFILKYLETYLHANFAFVLNSFYLAMDWGCVKNRKKIEFF